MPRQKSKDKKKNNFIFTRTDEIDPYSKTVLKNFTLTLKESQRKLKIMKKRKEIERRLSGREVKVI